MAVEHVDITDPEIHESKGVSTATVNQIYVANGTASGTWKKVYDVSLQGVSSTAQVDTVPTSDGAGGFVFFPRARGSLYYTNIGTGTTYAAPTTYTLIGPATTAEADPALVTHNSLGRLTYTGTAAADVILQATINIKHSVGGGADCYFQFHKNGVAITGTEAVVSADSTTYMLVSLQGNSTATTNDYFEVKLKTASGNIVVHAITLTLRS